MPYKILITGINRNNSGKTIVGVGIANGLKNKGYKVIPFKPFSFHNWFTQYSTTLENIKYGTIFSEDIFKLREVSNCRERYEVLNPVDNLIAPLDIYWFIEHNFTSMYYSYQLNIMRQILVTRVSYVNDRGRIFNLGILNKWLIDREIAYVDNTVTNSVTKKFDEIVEVNDLDTLAKIIVDHSARAIGLSCKLLEKYDKDIVLIESYSDSAWPFLSNISLDLVLAVAPGIVLVYPPEKYTIAVKIRTSIYKSLLGVSVKDILDYLSPIKHFKIPPVPSILIPETVEERIKELLDYIVSRIEEK